MTSDVLDQTIDLETEGVVSSAPRTLLNEVPGPRVRLSGRWPGRADRDPALRDDRSRCTLREGNIDDLSAT